MNTPIKVEWADVEAARDWYLEHTGLETPELLQVAFAKHRIACTQKVDALVEVATDLRSTFAQMAAPARVDPDKYFSEQVKAFGDAFGYGALMTTASALWRQDLGDLQGGEFTVGPCVTTAANQLKRLNAALAPFTKGQNDDAVR